MLLDTNWQVSLLVWARTVSAQPTQLFILCCGDWSVNGYLEKYSRIVNLVIQAPQLVVCLGVRDALSTVESKAKETEMSAETTCSLVYALCCTFALIFNTRVTLQGIILIVCIVLCHGKD